jgi:hypothetical protein
MQFYRTFSAPSIAHLSRGFVLASLALAPGYHLPRLRRAKVWRAKRAQREATIFRACGARRSGVRNVRRARLPSRAPAAREGLACETCAARGYRLVRLRRAKVWRAKRAPREATVSCACGAGRSGVRNVRRARLPSRAPAAREGLACETCAARGYRLVRLWRAKVRRERFWLTTYRATSSYQPRTGCSPSGHT